MKTSCAGDRRTPRRKFRRSRRRTFVRAAPRRKKRVPAAAWRAPARSQTRRSPRASPPSKSVVGAPPSAASPPVRRQHVTASAAPTARPSTRSQTRAAAPRLGACRCSPRRDVFRAPPPAPGAKGEPTTASVLSADPPTKTSRRSATRPRAYRSARGALSCRAAGAAGVRRRSRAETRRRGPSRRPRGARRASPELADVEAPQAQSSSVAILRNRRDSAHRRRELVVAHLAEHQGRDRSLIATPLPGARQPLGGGVVRAADRAARAAPTEIVRPRPRGGGGRACGSSLGVASRLLARPRAPPQPHALARVGRGVRDRDLSRCSAAPPSASSPRPRGSLAICFAALTRARVARRRRRAAPTASRTEAAAGRRRAATRPARPSRCRLRRPAAEGEPGSRPRFPRSPSPPRPRAALRRAGAAADAQRPARGGARGRTQESAYRARRPRRSCRCRRRGCAPPRPAVVGVIARARARAVA